VRLFNRVNGAPAGAWPVRGATFLNDVHVGPDGAVYVTDTGLNPDFSPNGSDAVWRFDAATGRATVVARGRELNGPNGVFATDSGVVVATWNGDVYRLDARGNRTAMPRPPAGGLDGLVRLPDGRWLVTSWNDSTVRRLAPGDTAWAMIIRSPSPADIGFDSRRARVLIPVFNANRVQIEPIGH
jgi:sugar lactone lactonase YvrE